MTISRPARRRWPLALAAAAAGLVLGLVLGLALGGGDDEADPEQALRDTRSTLTEAAGLLEVAQVEYGESVRDGALVREPEYRGARSAVERSRSLYLEARPAVVLIDGTSARSIDQAYAWLARDIARRVPAAQFERQTRRLLALLERPVGLQVDASGS